MNLAIKAILSCALLCVRLTQTSEIIIRTTQKEDCPQLAALSKKVINEDFKKIIINGYPDSPIAQNSELLDEYLNAMVENLNNLFDEKIILLEEVNKHLLVAVEQQNPGNILGLCFSQRQDDQVYVHSISVDKDCRGKGVGKALLAQSISLHKNITSCSLKTFAHANEDAHKFYERYGFVSDKKAAPLLRKHTEHSDTITFVLYKLDIH